ncbi:MAG: hypothetical protein V4657_07250 [Pseudomonadota bacterium]
MPANPTTPDQAEQIAENANCSQDRIAEARALVDKRLNTALPPLGADLEAWQNHYGALAYTARKLLAALNALPVEDMQVTDEMVERATNAMAEELRSNYVTVSGDLTSCVIDGGRLDLRDIARAALAASIGCGKD